MKWPDYVHPFVDAALRLPYAVLGRAHPLQRCEDIAPFFIVGSGRCGSTLLRRMLGAGGRVHIPPETYVLSRAIRFFRRNRDRSWPVLVRGVLSLFEYHHQFSTFDICLRPLAAELLDLPADQRSLAVIIDRFYRYHARSQNKADVVWGDKTPLYVFHMKAIQALFPRARFIHLLRDGIDVACSRHTAGFDPDLASAGLRWRDAVRAARDFGRSQQQSMIETRYEDLVLRPHDTLEACCRFIGVPYHADMVERTAHVESMGDVPRREHHRNLTRPVNADSIGRGRRTLTPDQRRQLAALIGADVVRLGYDPVEE
jgi:hypothetical protein